MVANVANGMKGFLLNPKDCSKDFVVVVRGAPILFDAINFLWRVSENENWGWHCFLVLYPLIPGCLGEKNDVLELLTWLITTMIFTRPIATLKLYVKETYSFIGQ